MFKKGDWIIATRPFRFGNGCEDRSYMSEAVEVVEATPHHIVYLANYSENQLILEPDRIEGQKFILAEPCIVKATQEKRSYGQIAQPTPKKKVLKTFECWVNAYPDGGMGAHKSLASADIGACEGRLTGKAFHFVGQYTVKE